MTAFLLAPSVAHAECVVDGTACDDGDACTVNDVCQSGVCIGQVYSCDDGNNCTTDICDGAGSCTNSPVSDGSACDDADACTTGDVCQSGVCTGGSYVCTDADGDGYPAGVDCDDSSPSCNVDCVTDADNDGIRDCEDLCLDADGDDFGNYSPLAQGCTICLDAACIGSDCDDMNDSIHPGATELCDGVDNNCSGTIDEGCVVGCGNGFIEQSEECDDGNLVGGDGCSSTCLIEIFGVPGDMNGDGKVNVGDLLLLERRVLGLSN